MPTRTNYKAPLIRSLREAGYKETDRGYARMTFTNLRKDGNRRVKLWFARDVFDSSEEQQKELERRLKANYGEAYLGGYFVRGAMCWPDTRSFCVVLNQKCFEQG